LVRPRKAREERRQWGAENNDDERTRTRDFIAGERGASERGADADQRDANEFDADEQETDGFLRQSRRGRERLYWLGSNCAQKQGAGREAEH
jgi:hypothetical protein